MRGNASNRLDPQPSELVDRSTAVNFQFDGRNFQAHEGDTVASALYAAGVSTLSRSFKYHRPRGLLCGAGRCPNCLVDVDGVPNVRACTAIVKEGMRVAHQNAWPSLKIDFLSILDRMQWLMPVGFYYKALHRPKLLWKLAEGVIRRVGGLGRIDIHNVPETDFRHRYHHTDVAVVGGGPAGLSAALAAAERGVRVTLIDDQPNLGGRLRYDILSRQGLPGNDEAVSESAEKLLSSVKESPHIETLSGATVFAHYQDNLLGVFHGDEVVKLRAKRVVLATGAYESPISFENNDLPGIMLGSAAQRLVRLYGVKPGNTAVVATVSNQGYQVALDLLGAGVNVVAVVDSRPASSPLQPLASEVESKGVPILFAQAVTKAEGKNRVRGVLVSPVAGEGGDVGTRPLSCDLVCVSGGFQPANALLRQAGAVFVYDDALSAETPWELPPKVFAAGEVTGFNDPAIAIQQGRLAGLEAASDLEVGASAEAISQLRQQLSQAEAACRESATLDRSSDQSSGRSSILSTPGKKSFLCFCEDVTVKDIVQAVYEGFDDIQILKRYSTATMGPCQGKMCLKSLVGLCSQATGSSIDDTGSTTSRPPLQPVPLAALAGPSHMPIKRTPLDRQHRALGATMVEVGPWQRAHSYGDPQEECLAVRQRVGIIDVSTLGKLDVSGGDAGVLLDRVYTHRFSNLGVGRIRYGLLCSDNGAILDDGTVTRLAEDRYFVTTTTGNVDLIEEWFNWWNAGVDGCAHVTNLTSAYAAVNVAGPKARETLVKLTNLDLSESGFRYMRSAQGLVAGVPAILLRIGFVGETGWEVHVPAEHGERLWDALMDAGNEFGISPFGLEAQRILRLEKKHIIVGQDTDAVSDPLGSGMDWVVRFDKEDFIGRAGLQGVNQRGSENKLVGFVMQNGQVPEDGVPVVADGKPIGKVTSARLSPTLGKGFGMAWVPAELADEGIEIQVLIDQKPVGARVTLQPFYDPEGQRLRQ